MRKNTFIHTYTIVKNVLKLKETHNHLHQCYHNQFYKNLGKEFIYSLFFENKQLSFLRHITTESI